MDKYKKQWTDGLPFERSLRRTKQDCLDNEVFKQQLTEDAINLAMTYDGETWLLYNARPSDN
jgi:hypothetical protein